METLINRDDNAVAVLIPAMPLYRRALTDSYATHRLMVWTDLLRLKHCSSLPLRGDCGVCSFAT